MKIRLQIVIKVMLAVVLAGAANLYADDSSVMGTWKTEAGDSGGYLYVDIAPCDDLVCGTIAKAFNKDNQEGTDYAHLGKVMIKGMRKKADGNYAKGKIWAPDKDKTYKSKMQLKEGKLLVSGCVAFICREQVWTRVK